MLAQLSLTLVPAAGLSVCHAEEILHKVAPVKEELNLVQLSHDWKFLRGSLSEMLTRLPTGALLPKRSLALRGSKP